MTRKTRLLIRGGRGGPPRGAAAWRRESRDKVGLPQMGLEPVNGHVLAGASDLDRKIFVASAEDLIGPLIQGGQRRDHSATPYIHELRLQES
jgi:hypothetical protein